jgi:hypothetical protein
MKNIWGFKLESQKFYYKTFETKYHNLEFEIKLFSHCFVAFEDQRDIVDR